MPAPDTTQNEQYRGFTGVILPPIGEGSGYFREKTPDGGYILWQEENVNGKRRWMPLDYHSIDDIRVRNTIQA